MSNAKRRLRFFILPWAVLLAVGLVAGCASGDGGTAAQQPQQPAAAADPAPAAPAPEPEAPKLLTLPSAIGSSPSTTPVDTSMAGPSKVAEEQFALFPQDGMPQYGGQMRIARREPNSLNYLDNATPDIQAAVNGVYEPLVRWDWRSGYDVYTNVTGGMAESWKVGDDGVTWTFTLRDDVKFHDGSPFTSADVKATYDHYLDPGDAGPPGRSYIQPYLESTEAPSPHTLVVKLKGPSPLLLMNLAIDWTMIAPKKGLDQGMDWFHTNINGTGPYVFVKDEWERGISYLWERNPNYFLEGVPYLDSKRSFIVPDAASELAAFETKKIDETRAASPRQIEAMLNKYGDSIRVLRVSAGSHGEAQYNATHPPFDDPRVRKALYLWMDRQEFLDKAANGAGELGEWIFPGFFKKPDGSGYGTLYEDLLKKNIAYQPDKTAARAQAKQLLAEAGYTDLSQFKVRVIPASPTGSRLRGAEIMVGEMRAMGFDAVLEPLDRLAAIQAFRNGDFGATFYSGVAPFPAPDSNLNRYVAPKGQRNYTHIEDPKFDSMLAELNRTVDQGRRDQILQDFDAYLQGGTYSTHVMYWAHSLIVRWDYLFGRRYNKATGENPDDHAWLGPAAPGRG